MPIIIEYPASSIENPVTRGLAKIKNESIINPKTTSEETISL